MRRFKCCWIFEGPAHARRTREKVEKYWPNPVNLAMSEGFRSHELTKVRALFIEHRALFLEKWNEHFGR